MPVLIAVLTFVATLVGGLIALKFRDKLHMVLGFSAGAVIGVAFFDLLPESLELAGNYYSTQTITMVVAIGFVGYLLLDRLVALHAHAHADVHDEHVESTRGILGAGSLSLHSFLDGVAIGLAFQVSTAIGGIVAVAVLVHDFADGVNTVGFILRNRGQGMMAFRWLVIDALAPVVGAASTLFFHLSAQTLAIVLAVFCGFFLYIGASDLVPESHHAHPKFLTTVMTLLGVVVLFVAIRLTNL